MRRRDAILLQIMVWILEASSLASCVSGQFTFLDSRFYPRSMVPITRLVVYANVTDDETFGSSMYETFRTRMESALARCGIKSLVVPEPMPRGRYLGEVVEKFQPTVALYIDPRRGLTVITQEDGKRVGASSHTSFKLTLSVLETREEIWVAQADLSVDSKSSISFGKEVAHSIIARLRDDGVLQDCPG